MMQYWLNLKSSKQEKEDFTPLDCGKWKWDSKSSRYFLDKSEVGFELSDAIYSVLEIDGDDEDSPHHCAVMEALEPMFKGEQKSGSFTVDGIFYEYEVKFISYEDLIAML